MSTIKDDGVAIRLWDFSETSQTAWIFTREHGLLRALAKGARRPRAPFSGGLDLLTRGELMAIVRPTSDLATLTAWDLLEVFWGARRSLPAHHASLYFADLVAHAITDHDPHPRLYDALLEGLRAVGEERVRGAEEAADMAWTIATFQWATLVETGYRPVLGHDVGSGGALPEGETLGFDPAGGGLSSDPGPEGQRGAWRVRATTVECLRSLDAGERSRPAGIEVDPAVRSVRLLHAYLAHIAGREPPTAQPLLGVLSASIPRVGG